MDKVKARLKAALAKVPKHGANRANVCVFHKGQDAPADVRGYKVGNLNMVRQGRVWSLGHNPSGLKMGVLASSKNQGTLIANAITAIVGNTGPEMLDDDVAMMRLKQAIDAYSERGLLGLLALLPEEVP